MSDYQLQASKFHKEAKFTGSGVMAPANGHSLRGETLLTVDIAGADTDNSVEVQGKLAGASSWDSIHAIIGSTTERHIDISGYDLIRFEVTNLSLTGTTGTLTASGFFSENAGAVSNLELQDWIEKEANGSLGKIYNEYSGELILNNYSTYVSTLVGETALKTSYNYSSGRVLAKTASLDTWTQTMQDAVDSAASDFDNNYSIDFDGLEEYINCGDVHAYDSSEAFTISMWVKPQNVSATRTLFAKATNDANVYGYYAQVLSGGSIRISARASGALRSQTFSDVTLSADTWKHVVVTYSGNNNMSGFKVYINGASAGAVGSGSIGVSWLSGQDFTIGSRNTSFYFVGNIDETSVWDLELSSSAVSELYNSGIIYDISSHSNSANLQSHYRMGDGDTIPNILDSVGSADGTAQNMDTGNKELDVA